MYGPPTVDIEMKEALTAHCREVAPRQPGVDELAELKYVKAKLETVSSVVFLLPKVPGV